MAVTRINNNQITDAITGNAQVGVNAASKIQNYTITSTKIANNLTYGSDLTITGNLTVQGQTTTVDTVNTLIQDPLITLADGQVSGAPTVDIGTIGLRGSQLSAVLGWKESALEFVTVLSNTTISNTTFNINSYANLHTGNLTVQGTTSLVGNVLGTANFTGNVNGGNLATAGAVSATGNVYAANFVGNVSGNVAAPGANTQVVFNDAGTANAVAGFEFDKTSNTVTVGNAISAVSTITGGNVATGGYVSATGTVTGGNVATGGTASATGTVTGGNLATGGTASATGTVTGGNIATGGTVSATGDITGANVSVGGNVIPTANVTYNLGSSTNRWKSLYVSGNTIYMGNVQLKEVDANVFGVYLGDGVTLTQINASVVSGTGNVTGGNIQTGGLVSSTGTVTGGNLATGGTISGTGTVTGGNLATGGTASATGTVTGGNLATGGTASATGTVTGGNIATGGTVSATGTITGGNVETAGTASATGNVSGGNIATGGIVSATGNITGSYFIGNGSMLTGVTASAVNANALTGNTLNSGVINSSLTSVGALTTLSVVGTTTSGNIATGGTVSSTGTVTGGNIETGGTVSSTGTVTGGNIATGGTVSSTGTVTGGNIATVGTVSATGSITGGNVYTGGESSTTGTVTGGNVATGGTVSSTGTVTGGNILTGGLVSSTGTVTGGNVATGGTISATSTITGGNVVTGGIVSAVGTVTGGNVETVGYVSATGTATAGNVATGGTVSATGNITGGNLLTSGAGGAISGTGNITGGNILTGGLVSATGNVYAANFVGNVSGNVAAPGANTQVVFNDAGTTNATSGFTFDKTSNTVTGGNLATGGTVSATGTVTGGNIATGGYVSATGNVTGGNIATTGALQGGNIVISGDNITDTNGRVNFNTALSTVDFAVNGTVANVFYVNATTGTASFGSATQTTNSVVAFNATNSVLMPVGNTAQRPATGVTGQFRFNTTINSLEVYNNSAWSSVGVPDFTLITDQQFDGTGSQTVFTLSGNATTAGTIVSINGVQQIPVTAYAVLGTTLTFTEAPAIGDLIDVRVLVTTTTVYGLSNSDGTAQVNVIDGSPIVAVTGDLSVSGSILGGNINSTAITFGSSNMTVVSSGGNIRANVAGTTLMTLSAGLVDIAGDLTVSGNATLSGNILGDSISNGTTSVQIQTPSGNANISVGGTSNVAVFAPAGLYITGNISATGDVIAQNVNSLSDATLKANIVPIENAGAVVDGLNGVGYDWINGSGHAYGLIAQKVEEVLPEAVKTDENGIKSINYSMVIPFLVETVKELRQDIAEIKTQLKK